MRSTARRGPLSVRPFVGFAVLSAALLARPPQAWAQGSESKHWGVEASFTPTWKAHDQLQQYQLFLEDWPLVEGSDFFVGVTRGKAHGAYWGVSYVRKTLKDGIQQTSSDSSQFCFGTNNATCSTTVTTDATTMNNVYLDGVEWHYFIPFAKFANHVQIGVTVGAGAGFPKGTVTEESTFTQTLTQPGRPPQVTTQSFSDQQTAADYMYKVTWLARAEVTAAFNIGPGLRAVVAGGVDAPSVAAFRVGVVYLIGAR